MTANGANMPRCLQRGALFDLEEFPLKITGTVVPMHDELKPGTLRSVLKLAKVDPGEFAEYL